MTFSFPSFFAAAINAFIDVGPLLVRWVTFAQFTLDAPAVDVTDTRARPATVAPATNRVPNFLFTSTFDYLRLAWRTTVLEVRREDYLYQRLRVRPFGHLKCRGFEC